ncbi:MAG TPA: DNA polymerase ligase N-terminal domain-containing protein [Jatrophihabitantaceae bacterium]|nr:DNA polymerase ligase N-terminal domain-containing protein [Jatrophihabitantaceae bacterium]
MARARSTGDRLRRYQAKRDFARTPEPAGNAAATGRRPGPLRFVVQRHRARALHYDFRLEMDGVLASWAVPKGPTLDPKVRRAAFHVEDHPIEYIDFEGIIPARQYGGGDVIVWDTGTWEPVRESDAADPVRAVADGEVHMALDGEKLHGRFVLVRTRRDSSGKEEWLMLHKNDEFAVAGWNAEDWPRSVLSGRTNDEVKADPDRLWRSDLPAARAAVLLKPVAVTAAELAQLDALGESGVWSVHGRDIPVTHLDAVMFAKRGRQRPVTKRELLRYAAQIGPTALPYLTDRALAVHRYPNGVRSKGSWQRAVPKSAPEWLPRWTNPASGRAELVAGEPAALVWVSEHGGIEWQVSVARTDAWDQPTHVVIDLSGGRWPEVLVAARLYRTAIDHLRLTARAKLSGAGGLEIWIPASGAGFADTRAWAEDLSESVAAVLPEMAKGAATVRIDHAQNAEGGAVIAPYSPRATPGAPVSAPVEWDALDDRGLKPDVLTVRSVPERADADGDPFRAIVDRRQALPALR